MKTHIITLSTEQQQYLEDITSSGTHKTRVIKRAQILLKSHTGFTDSTIADHVATSVRTVERVRARCSHSLERALFDAPRSGAPVKVTPTIEAYLIATACTDPPDDASHWVLTLLQESMVQAGYLTTISAVTLWRHMADRGIKPWLEKMWCIPKLTAKYIRRMEDILKLYLRPYNPTEPVVCFDEKSTQILAPTRDSLPLCVGKSKRADYEYERLGTRNIFVTVEPKAGKRRLKVTRKRKKRDFAYALKQLVINQYQQADTIHVVMDNLNTHGKKSLIDTFGETEADRLWSKITPHYTPTHASWLNMAEIEIGVLTRQVLKKRWVAVSEMVQAVRIWQRNRNKRRVKINWKFTAADARKKFDYDPTELM
jgi:transposase